MSGVTTCALDATRPFMAVTIALARTLVLSGWR
jgi:hypothetical protein